MTNGRTPKHPPSTSVFVQQVVLGIIVRCAVTSVPRLANKLNDESLWPLNFLNLPGLIASIALSGNVHNYSGTIALAVNVTFYGSLTYLFLRFRKKMVLLRLCPPLLGE
jgi:hypothetical protein